MAQLEQSFNNGTMFSEYAGPRFSTQSWDAELFLASNPKEARLLFQARGYEPPEALFAGLQRAGFEFEAHAYPETDYVYSTDQPWPLSGMDYDELACLTKELCAEINQ